MSDHPWIVASASSSPFTLGSGSADGIVAIFIFSFLRGLLGGRR